MSVIDRSLCVTHEVGIAAVRQILMHSTSSYLCVTHEVGIAAVRQILMHGTSSYHVLSTQAGPDWGGMEAGAGVYAVWGTLLSRVGG